MTRTRPVHIWFSVFTIASTILLAPLMLKEPAMASETKLVIAHRGASGYLPEHTLPAKAMAHAMGADYIEQDVVLTKDGIPIVLHDIHLDTVSNVAEIFPTRNRADGKYYAIDFTLAEIRTLALHERTRRNSKSSVFPNRFPQNLSAFSIPTLMEEIELIQGLNKSTGRDTGIYPEIKAPDFHRENGFDLSRIVIDVLHKYGYRSKEDKVILQCFDWKENQRIRDELGFKGRMVQLLGENNWGISRDTDYDYLKSQSGLIEMARTVDGIGPWINQIVTGINTDSGPEISDLVKNAHAAGLKVHPYTARADKLPKWAATFDKLLETILHQANADGIFTDFPDLAVKYVNATR